MDELKTEKEIAEEFKKIREELLNFPEEKRDELANAIFELLDTIEDDEERKKLVFGTSTDFGTSME